MTKEESIELAKKLATTKRPVGKSILQDKYSVRSTLLAHNDKTLVVQLKHKKRGTPA